MEGVMEKPVSLSRSVLWPAQMRFYERHGPKSWEVVPEYMSSNGFIARQYTQLIVAHIRDCFVANALDLSRPLYVLEIGAGSGKLAFLIVKKLFGEFSSLLPAGLRVVYLVTVCATLSFAHCLLSFALGCLQTF